MLVPIIKEGQCKIHKSGRTQKEQRETCKAVDSAVGKTHLIPNLSATGGVNSTKNYYYLFVFGTRRAVKWCFESLSD